MKLLNTFRSGIAGLVLLASVIEVGAQNASLSVLHQFTAGNSDGASPYSEVTMGADSGLYGTTWSGGTNAAGTVFRLNPDGSGFAILHHFTNGADGATPFDGVTQGADGFLYGTTYYGGAGGDGTVFKINTNGSSYSILHSFTNSPDGANPYGTVIQGRDGWLYGTTEGGGSGPGTVFKMDTNGNNFAVLHAFTNFTDATTPFGRLVQASNGMLYGTTDSGGASVIGAIFQIDTNGLNYSVIHSFDGSSDGFSSECGLLAGQDGWLYGTAVSGGNASAGSGTVFKLSTSGSGFAVLHTFTNSPDGAHPRGRVAQGGDGILYGVTADGGATNNAGVIFGVSTNGANYSVMHRFNGNSEGSKPWAGLFTAGNGVFYGTALQGGNTNAGFGTVYRFALVPSLTLNVASSPTFLLTLNGAANQSCQVQVSSNLVDWSFLGNVSLTNGSAQILDANATQAPVRFYRAVIP